MKKLTVLLFPALVLGMLTAGFAYAQTATILRGDIPFEFTVVGKTLPAGSYGVVRNSILPIRNSSFAGSRTLNPPLLWPLPMKSLKR